MTRSVGQALRETIADLEQKSQTSDQARREILAILANWGDVIRADERAKTIAWVADRLDESSDYYNEQAADWVRENCK